MGAGLSKHEDEVKADNRERAAGSASASAPKILSTDGDDNVAIIQTTAAAAAAASDANTRDTESVCPMKMKDGSYTMDWGALFRPAFPHGPGGKKPLTEEEAREKVNQPEKMTTTTTTTTPTQTLVAAGAGEGCPVKHEVPAAAAAAATSEGCPVKHQEYNVYSQPIDPSNNMPTSANQLRGPGQSKDLPTDRVKSSIAKGGADEGTTWTYPSPQMFYNALARKGKLGDTGEEEVESVVALHNNMNEKTWRKVLEWEQVLYPGESPKLLKFMGRPTDLSPKAMAKHYLLGHPLPYDRHDWTVLRKDGSTVRYLIDYYYDDTLAIDDEKSGMPTMDDTSATPSLLVDVRPALDGPKEFWSRAVTMPYAQTVAKSTTYTSLPLRPTEQMRSQVPESIETWAHIQAAAAESKAKAAEVTKSLPEVAKEKVDFTEKEALVLSYDFAQALRDCRETSLRVKNAESEMDQAKARMDLTICMGKIVCPLPHEAFTKSLTDESADSDDKIEAAINNMTECVYLKTGEHSAAREKFPKLFTV